jgi:hypothetical protein
MKSEKYTCPECHAKEGVDILYGYPSEDTSAILVQERC